MIKYLSFLTLVACGGPIATKCYDTGFHSVESVLPMDCELFNKNVDLCENLVNLNTQITDWRSKMRHVKVRVRSVEEWQESVTNEFVIGETVFTSIGLDRSGISLCHESLHAFDIVSYSENVGTIIESPVLLTQEMNHHDWGVKGYWNTDHAFESQSCPLQNITWHDPNVVVSDCYTNP